MSRRAVWIVAGVLVVAGAAAAVGAVGDRHPHFAAGDMIDDMGFGPGMDRLPGDGNHRGPRMAQGGMEPGFGPGMGPGGMGRGMGPRGERGGRPVGPGGMWGGPPRAMTADEFDARTRERFARLDKNSDGVIDASEIETAITARADSRGPSGNPMQQRFLAAFDANQDGKVTKDEFLDHVKKQFARADLTSDGRITDDDLPPMMRGRDVLKNAGASFGHHGMGGIGGMGGMGRMGGLGSPIFGRWLGPDAGKDGVISLDEVLAGAGKEFARLDRNNDGAIDATDFDAMRKEMATYRVQRFLHAFGADKDGKVTRDQFFKAAKERFAERDINRDGRIDRDDFGPGRGPRGPGPRGPGAGGPGAGPGGPGPGLGAPPR